MLCACWDVAYVTGASNWSWLTVGQGLLSLWQVGVEGECFFTFIPVLLSSQSLSLISNYLFSPFLWEMTQMTYKGWRVIKPQQSNEVNFWQVY